MSTCNFYYQNRCIVITDNDYEMDNLPPMGQWSSNGNRNYPSRQLASSEDYNFFDIVVNVGYYADACIDYMRNECTIEDFLGDIMYYSTKREFFNACKQYLGLTETRLKKICGNVKDFSDYEEWIRSAYDKITDYLVDMEEYQVNAYLDNIKLVYGYEEVKCTSVFSNGEGIYEKVS